MAKKHQKQDPHYLIAVCDAETDEVLAYRTVPIRPDKSYQVRTDKDQTHRIVGEAVNAAGAEALMRSLENWGAARAALVKEGPDLPQFDESLPIDPRARAAAFLSLRPEQQEEVVCRAIMQTGMPIKKVAAWLNVKDRDLEAIDADVLAAAKGELEMRIAKKMIEFTHSKSAVIRRTRTSQVPAPTGRSMRYCFSASDVVFASMVYAPA